MFELHHLTAQEQWNWLQRGEITPRELVDHYLARIDRLDPELGAFVTVTADAARERASSLAEADDRLSSRDNQHDQGCRLAVHVAAHAGADWHGGEETDFVEVL